MNLVNVKVGASTLSQREKWRKNLEKWKINSDRHRIDAHYDDLSFLSPYLDDITASIKGFERVSVTEQEVIDARQVCESQSQVYGNEAQRQVEFLKTVQKFFIIKDVADAIDTTENIYLMRKNLGPDGFIQCPVSSTEKYGISCLFEAKNEFGTGGDATIQVCFDYAKVAKKMNDAGVCGFLPSVLLTLEGSFLSVGIGAVSHEVCVQFCVEKFNLDSHDNHHATAKLLVSIRNAIRLASTMYLEYEKGDYVFPVAPQMKLLGLAETLKIVARVSEDKRVFCALADSSSIFCGHMFALKYTGAKYSLKLHHRLANEGYAPILHSTQLLQSQYQCILMDWVDGGRDIETLGNLKISERHEIAKHLIKIVTLMKQNGYVHGDLRYPNIIVGADLKPMIIDYDWAGAHQTARYPFNLDYEQFPWLPPEGSSGLKIKFSDDEDAIKYYIRYYLLLTNDVIISGMLDVGDTDIVQAPVADVTSTISDLNLCDDGNSEKEKRYVTKSKIRVTLFESIL